MIDPVEIAQAMVDTMAWLLMPFAGMLAIEWAIGLFRRDY